MKLFLMLLAFLTPPIAVAASGKNVTYVVNGKDYEGFFTAPKSRKAPTVLLLHDWDGLTDYEKKRAEMFRKEGFAVFAADLFGKGIRPTKIEDRRQHTGELYSDREKMRKLTQGALQSAREQGANIDNVVVLGYCFGGAAALEMARSGADIRGYISVHGGLTTPEGQDYKKTKGQILVQHGAADTSVTFDQFFALGQELEAAGVNHEMIAYGGAPHAWTVYGNDNYREQADQRAWRRQLDFIKEVVKH